MRSSKSSKWIVVVVVAFAMAFFALPKSAKACGGGNSSGGGSSGMDGLVVAVAVVGIGMAATDVGMSLYDVGKGVAGEHTSKGYAIFETSFAGAQAAGVWLVVSETRGGVQWSPAMIAIAAVPTLLTLHGVLTLATVDWNAEKQARFGPADPRAMPYGTVPYAPYAPAPPPAPPPPETSSTNDAPSVPPPAEPLRVRFMPTMLPNGTPGNVSLAPGIAAWGTF